MAAHQFIVSSKALPSCRLTYVSVSVCPVFVFHPCVSAHHSLFYCMQVISDRELGATASVLLGEELIMGWGGGGGG